MAKTTKKITIFGEHLRELLVQSNMTLRELARRTGIDPSNLSKIERGVVYPPKKKETLDKMANAFSLERKSKRHFFDMAEQVHGLLPDDLKAVKENKAIPLLLRTIDNRRLSYEQTVELAKLIEKENSWQGIIPD